MFDPSPFANPTPLAHADTSRDVLPRGGTSQDGRSYRRISHINDTGAPSYRGPNVSNYSPTNSAPISKNGPEGNLIQGPLRASYASGNLPSKSE
ncbi:hypothetical protein TNCV_2875511 [Trichonephila clavipes]|nr:hypothetical protein TNCV_2875511 [Trichonephila clavipes]